MAGYWNRCFPNAELKIFMTASATIRAKRHDELIEKGNVLL
jgi:cytidylate kinase